MGKELLKTEPETRKKFGSCSHSVGQLEPHNNTFNNLNHITNPSRHDPLAAATSAETGAAGHTNRSIVAYHVSGRSYRGQVWGAVHAVLCSPNASPVLLPGRAEVWLGAVAQAALGDRTGGTGVSDRAGRAGMRNRASGSGFGSVEAVGGADQRASHVSDVLTR